MSLLTLKNQELLSFTAIAYHNFNMLYCIVFIYRINGAHGSLEFISKSIDRIRSILPNAKILIDLPGNKIRLNNIEKPIAIKYGDEINLSREHFNCSDFFDLVKNHMEFFTNEGQDTLLVIKHDRKSIQFKSLSNGVLLNNKGFTATGINKSLPFLFEKDKQLLQLIHLKSIDYAGLSFTRTYKDILTAKEYAGFNQQFMVKVETRDAIGDLKDIFSHSEYILIDRGDLSLEVGVENVPYYIDYVLKNKMAHNKIFIATQFLKFMETHPVPLLSEINDIYNTLQKDIEGIQLSEETAIGHFPVECLQVVSKIMDIIYSSNTRNKLNEICQRR